MCSYGGSWQWAYEATQKSPYELHEPLLVMTLRADQGLKGSIQGHSYHCCPHRTLPLREEKTMAKLDPLVDIFGNQRLALNAL